MQLASRIFEAEDLEAAVELCYRNKWTDGLPVVPPTRSTIERILSYLQRDPGEVVGIVPPRNAKLHAEARRAFDTPEIARRMKAEGTEIVLNAPRDFASEVKRSTTNGANW